MKCIVGGVQTVVRLSRRVCVFNTPVSIVVFGDFAGEFIQKSSAVRDLRKAKPLFLYARDKVSN